MVSVTQSTSIPVPAPLPAAVTGRTLSQRFLFLAVASLVISGVFSLLCVFGRMPPFDTLVTDPDFFRRCLAVHVDLALVIWFYAFLGALFFSIPVADNRGHRVAGVGSGLAVVGLALVVCGVFWPGAPIMSNYVPVIDHPAFLAGLALFALGLAICLAGPRLLPGAEIAGDPLPLPPASRTGVRAAAVAVLLALLTFGVSAITTERGVWDPRTYYELIFWGGGHVLQFASTAAMLAVWVALIASAVGRVPVSRKVAAGLFAILVLPVFGAPLLAGVGTETATYRTGFTTLMQWGIFPVALILLGFCLVALYRVRGQLSGWRRDPRLTGFAASAGLCVLGFTLGALIRGSNTMVPAHYHASIGAVSASFMAMTYVLLDTHGAPIPTGRARRWAALQPLLFGVGQMVFAVGFGMAGIGGAARKAFGAEQAARTTSETVGLFIMGAGGLVAVAGGVLFLGLVIVAWRRSRGPVPGSETWLDRPLFDHTHCSD